jgi:hypothetical protein
MSFPRELLEDVVARERLEANTRPRSSLSLYEPFAELRAWADSYELAETDEERAEIAARIGAYLTQGKHAVDHFNAGDAFLASQIELCKAEVDRINSIKRRLERLQGEMERSAIKTLEALGVKKLEGNTSFLRIQKKPDAVEVFDAAAVPLEYKRATVDLSAAEAETIKSFFPEAEVTHAVDRRAVGAAIKAGAEVPGAKLTGGNSLRRK